MHMLYFWPSKTLPNFKTMAQCYYLQILAASLICIVGFLLFLLYAVKKELNRAHKIYQWRTKQYLSQSRLNRKLQHDIIYETLPTNDTNTIEKEHNHMALGTSKETKSSLKFYEKNSSPLQPIASLNAFPL